MADRLTRIFVLLHGTWALNAPWTREGSDIRKALTKAFVNDRVKFETPQWRGFLGTRLNNGHGYRLAGATHLKAKLRELRTAEPKAKIYLIGHSHGGNVAIYATNEVPETVNGIVCLGTPFFSILADFSGYRFLKSAFALVDNPVVLPWLALVMSALVLLGTLGAFGFVTTMFLIPWLPLWAVNWLIAPALGLISLALMAVAYRAGIVGYSASMIWLERVLRGTTAHVSRRDFDLLSSLLPPNTPCRWLSASSDEVARVFAALERMTDLIRRALRIIFAVLGVGTSVGLAIAAFELGRNFDKAAPVWGQYAGGAILAACAFFLSGIVAYYVLGALAFALTRALYRLRTIPLLMGWEGISTTLFTSLAARPTPASHQDLDSSVSWAQIGASKLLHSGCRYKIKAHIWQLSHSLYAYEEAINDIVATIRLFDALPPVPCSACERLRSRHNDESSMESHTTDDARGVEFGKYVGGRSYPIHWK